MPLSVQSTNRSRISLRLFIIHCSTSHAQGWWSKTDGNDHWLGKSLQVHEFINSETTTFRAFTHPSYFSFHNSQTSCLCCDSSSVEGISRIWNNECNNTPSVEGEMRFFDWLIRSRFWRDAVMKWKWIKWRVPQMSHICHWNKLRLRGWVWLRIDESASSAISRAEEWIEMYDGEIFLAFLEDDRSCSIPEFWIHFPINEVWSTRSVYGAWGIVWKVWQTELFNKTDDRSREWLSIWLMISTCRNWEKLESEQRLAKRMSSETQTHRLPSKENFTKRW
jgi:hypothetical protein